jgi:ketosteroid isomerase-like protein
MSRSYEVVRYGIVFHKLLVGAALSALLIPAVSAQDRNDPVESKIIALEKAWNQAYKFRDKKALGEILSDSIILVNDDGSVLTKAAFLGAVDSAPSSDEQQAEPESITVHVFGDVAVATGVFRIKGVEKGKPFVRRNRFADTWVSKGGSWVCISGSATPLLH